MNCSIHLGSQIMIVQQPQKAQEPGEEPLSSRRMLQNHQNSSNQTSRRDKKKMVSQSSTMLKSSIPSQTMMISTVGSAGHDAPLKE